MAMAADGDGGSGDVDHLGGIGAPALGEEPAMALEDLQGVGQVEGRNLAGSFTPVVPTLKSLSEQYFWPKMAECGSGHLAAVELTTGIDPHRSPS